MNDDRDIGALDARTVGDLEQILGYVGASDETSLEMIELAPDIFQLPFWTEAFCASIVRAAEAVGFTPGPDDPVPGFEVSLAAISPALFSAVERDIGVRVWPVLRREWPLIEYRGLRDAFVIRYRAGQQVRLRLHQDIAQVSATVRLNDDYEGAELTFPRQRWDNGAQPVGSLVAWPSLVTHPHESLPLRSGTKYALTVWCELPDDIDHF